MPKKSALVWIGLAAATAGTAVAQSSGGDFAITRQVVAGGGTVVSGGELKAVVTIGQPSVELASGGPFTVRGGFHVPAPRFDALFSDGFEGVTP